MKKSDLKTGMIVELVDNEKFDRFVVMKNSLVGEGIISGIYDWSYLENFEEDLTHILFNELSINRVYENISIKSLSKLLNKENSDGLKLLWEREEGSPIVEWEFVKCGTKVKMKDLEDEGWYDGVFVGEYNGLVAVYLKESNYISSWDFVELVE